MIVEKKSLLTLSSLNSFLKPADKVDMDGISDKFKAGQIGSFLLE